jgi:hypothetical protein
MEKLTSKFKMDMHVLDSLLSYPECDINHIIQRQMSDIITNELQKKLEITDKFDKETNTTEYSTEFLLLNKSDVDYIMLNLKNIMYCSEQGWNEQIPSKLKNIQENLLYGKKEI